MEPRSSLSGDLGHPFGAKFAIVAPLREPYYLPQFNHIQRSWGRPVSPLQPPWGRAWVPECLFSFFLSPSVPESGATGSQRHPNVAPNALKSPPGELQQSMKNLQYPGASGGCPGSPGWSRGIRRLEKITQNHPSFHLVISPKTKKNTFSLSMPYSKSPRHGG